MPKGGFPEDLRTKWLLSYSELPWLPKAPDGFTRHLLPPGGPDSANTIISLKLSPMSLGERLLTALSRDPAKPDYPGGTVGTIVDNALAFILKTVPGFFEMVEGKEVLDFGCGWGIQAAALAKTKARLGLE